MKTSSITCTFGTYIHNIARKTKLGVEMHTKVWYEKGLSKQSMYCTQAAQNFINHINEIAMKISLDWSNQADSKTFQMSLFSISIMLAIGYVAFSNLKATHNVSPNGDTSW
jgi:hypothetical protein